MYTKDKAQRITLRVNEDQWQFIKECSDTLGVSPSDFLRMMVNTGMVTWKQRKEGERRENEQTDKHDSVPG